MVDIILSALGLNHSATREAGGITKRCGSSRASGARHLEGSHTHTHIDIVQSIFHVAFTLGKVIIPKHHGKPNSDLRRINPQSRRVYSLSNGNRPSVCPSP